MSTPSPYGPQPVPQPTTPIPTAPAYVVPVRQRVPAGRAVRATVLWSLGSGVLAGAAIALVALFTGAVINSLNSVDDNDFSPWWALFAFAIGTALATIVASFINVPVLLLMRINDGFAAMSPVVQGLLAWLAGWIPVSLFFLVIGVLSNHQT